LPSSNLGNKTKGLVTISVANIRVQPSHRAELATQATMGTPVKVWKRERGWYLVQTPDQYLGWVDNEAIVPVDSSGYRKWHEMPKIIFTDAYGLAYDITDRSATVTDLVYGDVMAVLNVSAGYVQVLLPDGRKASVLSSQCMDYHSWRRSRNPWPDSIVAAAKKLMGVPYLWGGTSFKGVDCSGFTKTVYFMNGIVLPRDASQQAVMGQEIITSNGWQQLQPGDLLFFGSKARENAPERVVHVGIWIGNNEFIHASGKVQVASFDPSAPNYDGSEHKRFLRAKRLLPGGGLYDLRKVELF
jgi:gamma-D-glutamyl-L-lysine dipeptidyl-peptidase